MLHDQRTSTISSAFIKSLRFCLRIEVSEFRFRKCQVVVLEREEIKRNALAYIIFLADGIFLSKAQKTELLIMEMI